MFQFLAYREAVVNKTNYMIGVDFMCIVRSDHFLVRYAVYIRFIVSYGMLGGFRLVFVKDSIFDFRSPMGPPTDLDCHHGHWKYRVERF